MPSERERLEQVYGTLLTDATIERWSESNPGNRAILSERVRCVRDMLAMGTISQRSGKMSILDLGSGGNTSLTPELDAASPDVTRIAVDLLFERLRHASPGVAVGLVCADGVALPFGDRTFDLVTLFTVFSSVGADTTCRAIAREVDRVLAPGGRVLWYDLRYRNPRNRELRPFPRRQVEAMFPGFAAEWRSITVVPPLARRLGRATATVYPIAAALPPLRGHLLGVLTKPRSATPSG